MIAPVHTLVMLAKLVRVIAEGEDFGRIPGLARRAGDDPHAPEIEST